MQSTSAQYNVSIKVQRTSLDIHRSMTLHVHTMAVLLALTPLIENGSISSNSVKSDLLLLTALFAHVSFCTISVYILNVKLSCGLVDCDYFADSIFIQLLDLWTFSYHFCMIFFSKKKIHQRLWCNGAIR